MITLLTELIGAALLTGCFLNVGDTLSLALWRGLFTSISAFCNAGFALWVIGRANNAMHRRILQLVGAHLVVNPEEEFGRRFANRVINRQVISDMPLSEDLHLTELSIHPSAIIIREKVY